MGRGSTESGGAQDGARLDGGLPAAFAARLRKIIPAVNLPSVLAALDAEDATLFRIRPPGAETEAVLAQLCAAGFEPEPLAWCSSVYRIPAGQRRAVTEHRLFRDGGIYIQNPSSLMAVLAISPQPGEEIMDMCAAPGGKTLAIVDAMESRGRVAAVEAVRGRFFKLKHLMQRYRAEIVQCYQTDARNLWRKVPERFDRILLDAPCSSESRIRANNPDSWKYWGLKKNREMSRKQQSLIRSAFDCLKPGGVLVYCTCTYAPEENELIVQSLLDRFDDAVQIEAVDLPCPNQMAGLTAWQGRALHPDLAKAVRILPDGVQDAFFLCRLRKSGSRP